jgi:hypothetical protein
MFSKKKICFIFIVSFLYLCPVYAEDAKKSLKGVYSIGLNGSYSSSKMLGTNSHNIVIGGEITNFFTRNVELGCQVFHMNSWSRNHDVMFHHLNFISNYNYYLNNVNIPYLGLSCGLTMIELFADEINTDTSLGFQFGLKNFIHQNVFFKSEYRFRHTFGDYSQDDSSLLFGINLLY